MGQSRQTGRARQQASSGSTLRAPSVANEARGNAAAMDAMDEDVESEVGGGILDLFAASSGAPPAEPLPHRPVIEAALGVDLGDLTVIRTDDMPAPGANAAATADGIFLGDDDSLEVVAEEVVHYLQAQGGGGAGGVSDPNDPEEWEAQSIAAQIAAGETPEPIQERATKKVMRNTGDGLNEAQRRQLGDLAQSTTNELFAELDATWTNDGEVRGIVHRFRTQVRELSPEPWFMAQALRILRRTYHRHATRTLKADIRAGTSEPDLGVLLGQITPGNAEPPAPAPAPEEATSTQGGSGQEGEAEDGAEPAAEGETEASNRLTSAQRELVDSYADRCVAAIRTELRATFHTEDANVLSGLRAWNASLNALLDRGDSAPTGATRRGLIRQAQGILRHRYGNQTGHSLEIDVNNGVQLQSKADALRLIGRSGSSGAAQEEEAAAPENPRARARLACWQDCQTMEREIQEMATAIFRGIDAGQIVSAHNAALRACEGAGVTQDADRRAVVRATYREVAGADLAAHLSTACAGHANLAISLSEDLGIRFSTPSSESASESADDSRPNTADTAAGCGHILQALHVEFRRTITVDDDALALCRQLNRYAVASAGERDAANIGRWNEERDRALTAATDDYGRRFGVGLATEVRSHVWDSAKQRQCLDAIGDRGRVSEQVATAVVEGSENGGDELLAATDELTTALQAIAGALRDELDDTFVNSGIVRRQCHAFHTTYQRFQGDSRFGDRMQTQAFARGVLMQLYTDLGGNLVEDIDANVSDHADKDACFRSLGLGYTGLAVSLEEQGQAASADVGSLSGTERLQAVLLGRINELFAAVASLIADRRRLETAPYHQAFSGKAGTIGSKHTATIEAAQAHGQDLQQAKRSVWNAYRDTHGMRLGAHLAMACDDARRARSMSRYVGFDVSVGDLAEADSQGEVDTSIEIGEGTRERANSEGEYEAFDHDDAYRLARQLHDAGDRRDRAEFTAILSHDRPAAERRAIIAMFESTYHTPLRFFMRNQFGVEGSDLTLVEAAASESGDLDLIGELTHMVQARDESIYQRVMRLNPAEKQQVLADSHLMSEIRDAFGDDGYERVRNTLTGHLGIDDMMRTRDTETFWGMGTDDEGFQGDLTAYVQARRNEELPRASALADAAIESGDIELSERSEFIDAEVRGRIEPELVRMAARADAVDAVFAELSGDDVNQAMMRLDTVDGALDHVQAAIADPTGAQLLTHLRALDSDERNRLLHDEDFQTQIQGNSGTIYNQAMAILRGQSGMADIEAGLDPTLDTDETQVFRGLTEGDADQMRRLSENRGLQDRITGSLDGGEEDSLDTDAQSERGLFNDMMNEFGELDPDAADTVEQRRTLKIRELQIRHKFRILAGLQDDTDALLRAAQELYNERGQFKATPESEPEYLFDPDQSAEAGPARRHIEGEVMATVRSELGATDELVAIVRDAILHRADPARERLGRATEYITDEEGVTNTLDSVSNETLANEWSNIRRDGRGGSEGGHTPPFASVVGAWLATDRQEDGREFTRMLNYRLGLSDRVDERLREDFMVGDAELDTWRSTLQRRILALPWAAVRDALIAGGATGVTDEDREYLFGDDRAVRSRMAHSEDRFEQAREQGSAIDGMADSDDAVDRAYLQLHGEYEGALADDGLLSEEEIIRIREREGDVTNATAEYRQAKADAASYATGVAVVIIGAVGTVVAGPGGPSFAAAMATALTQAAVTTALDEAIQGRDFEAVTEGMRRAATECATAGLTHGLSSLGSAAANNIDSLGDLVTTSNAWRAGLQQAASTSRVALLQHALVTGAFRGLGTIQSNATEAIVSLLDDLFTNGWDRTIENHPLGAGAREWTLEALETFVSSTVTTYTQGEISRIFADLRAGRTTADAIEDGIDGQMGPDGVLVPATPSTGRALGRGARDEAINLGEDVANEGAASLGRGAGNMAEDAGRDRELRALDQDNYESSDLGDAARGLATRTTRRHASGAGRRRTTEEAAAIVAQPGNTQALRVLRRPEGMTQAQLNLLFQRHVVEEGEGASLTEFASGPLARIRVRLARVLAEPRETSLNTEERAAFIGWVVGRNGSGAEGRLQRSGAVDTFRQAASRTATREADRDAAITAGRAPSES